MRHIASLLIGAATVSAVDPAVVASGFLTPERMTTIGNVASQLNKGAMRAMQKDMSQKETNCAIATDKTNVAIKDAFNLSKYPNEKFDVATFANTGQVMALQLMDQFTRCNYVNFLIELDTAFSKTPQLTGSISNLATQLFTGRENRDTAIYMTLSEFKGNYDASDWESLGQNLQLFSASLLKYEAPDVSDDVKPMNS